MYHSFFLSILLLFRAYTGAGQVQLEGPVCVSTNTVYLYTIKADWKESTIIQVCVTGGIFEDTKTNCYEAKDISSVKISWTESLAAGTLTVKYPGGSQQLAIKITTPLNGGNIAIDSRSQLKDTLTLPSLITCGAASGGHCSPSYSYQWQESDNALKWDDIPKATAVSLKLSKTLKEARYYRRKVTENNSGTIAYSDIAMVDISIYQP